MRGAATKDFVMPKCPQCSREFKNAFALKIHVGRMHQSAGAKPATKRRRGRPPGRPSRSTTELGSVATAALLAEIKRRADTFDRLKDLADRL